MKIGFGLIYLLFVAVGILYELLYHYFSINAIVNYTLEGFLISSGAFILFFIVAKIVLWTRSRRKENK